MVRGRRLHPLVNYRYMVNGETYFEPCFGNHRDCTPVPNNTVIDIIYLENDPAASIVGNAPEQYKTSGLGWHFAFGAVGFGLWSLLLTISALSYSPAIREWLNQAPRVVALPGEIVAVKEKRRRTIEITYYYQSPEGKSLLRKEIMPRRKRNPPQAGMYVVVLYYDYDQHIITLA
jgi:hypothetical protein